MVFRREVWFLGGRGGVLKIFYARTNASLLVFIHCRFVARR